VSEPKGAVPPDLLADAVAELYQADPDSFTERRQELVTSAREAGQAAVAKQIAGLRKPTRSAWVVNRLVRADPRVASRLAALAAELRDEPSMDGTRIRELTAARGRLVDELTRQALQVPDLPAPPAALREEVTATLDAAIADPEVAANLGTLVRAARWAGFGLAPGAPVPDAAAPPPSSSAQERTSSPAKNAPATNALAKDAPSTTRTPKPEKPGPAEAAAERDRRRQEKIQLAERAVAEADQAADSANEAEQDLEDTVRRLEAELADARQRLAEARRQSYRAVSRQRRANAELGRLRE
jgi:hypothetical protein